MPTPPPSPNANPEPTGGTPPPSPLRPYELFIIVTTPLLLLLPPRKLDLYTFSLGTAFVLSAQHLVSTSAPPSFFLAPHRSRAAAREEQEEEQGGIKGMARRIWMGDETEGWKERRIRREREVLEEGDGEGYKGLIGETVLEVFARRKGALQKGDDNAEGE